MKKLIGNFTTPEDYEKFQTWLQKAEIDLEPLQTSLTNEPFKRSGYIIFDETTPHGTILFNHLLTIGWIQDTDYDPLLEEKRQQEEETVRKAREAEQKKAQDEINEKENKPNLLKSLKEIPYQEKTEVESNALTFKDLAEYHSKMVLKQNCIYEILKLKGMEDNIQNWNAEGKKTFDELELEIKSLKENNNER